MLRAKKTEKAGRPDRPEIVFGLTAPVGVNLEEVSQLLTDALASVNYDCQTVRLSELLHDFAKYKDLMKPQPEEKRIHAHMDAGNDIRQRTRRNDILALLAVGAIVMHRQEVSGDGQRPISRKAYILRSLKHPDEVETLRKIYGLRFHMISASSTRDIIVKFLARRIADSHNNLQSREFMDEAERLVTRDESEEAKHGQQLRKTFHKADLFIDVNDTNRVRAAVSRYVESVFGHPFHTPTRDEYGMFHAHAAALRSASLGRQVGAAVATNEGDIIAVGTNEVPKRGGGLYWEGDESDKRDHVLGFDSSDEMKRRILADILSRLKERDWLIADKARQEVQALVKEALADEQIRSMQMMYGIEFMRAVHAEMAALVNAATRGVSVKGCTLYTTTFPCHDCAKHIVAAGIERVFYVEPYPKSLAVELYPDSVSVESSECGQHQVPFAPFVGIAPRKYMEVFTMTERKDAEGKIVKWNPGTSLPRSLGYSPSFYTAREALHLELINEGLAKAGLLN